MERAVDPIADITATLSLAELLETVPDYRELLSADSLEVEAVEA